jgi:hypothetical protein
MAEQNRQTKRRSPSRQGQVKHFATFCDWLRGCLSIDSKPSNRRQNNRQEDPAGNECSADSFALWPSATNDSKWSLRCLRVGGAGHLFLDPKQLQSTANNPT